MEIDFMPTLWDFLPSWRLPGALGRDRDVARSPSFWLVGATYFVFGISKLHFLNLKEVLKNDFLTTFWVFIPSMRLGQARGRVLGVALSPPFGVEITH